MLLQPWLSQNLAVLKLEHQLPDRVAGYIRYWLDKI